MERCESGKAGAAPAGRSPYAGKRVLDVAVGLVLSILTLPLILVLAAISAVKFRSSPFFVQERVGLNGELFRCVKIRSLPVDDARLPRQAGAKRPRAPDWVVPLPASLPPRRAAAVLAGGRRLHQPGGPSPDDPVDRQRHAARNAAAPPLDPPGHHRPVAGVGRWCALAFDLPRLRRDLRPHRQPRSRRQAGGAHRRPDDRRQQA